MAEHAAGDAVNCVAAVNTQFMAIVQAAAATNHNVDAQGATNAPETAKRAIRIAVINSVAHLEAMTGRTTRTAITQQWEVMQEAAATKARHIIGNSICS